MRFESESIRTERAGKTVSEESGAVEAPITFQAPLRIFALVEDGWLPLVFVRPPQFMVDSNVIVSLEQLVKGNSGTELVATEWWLKSIDESSLLLNPLPYAFEGFVRRPPTLEEFSHAFEDASNTIKNHLPTASTVVYEDEHFEAGFSLITDIAARNANEIAFLKESAPMVCSGISLQNCREVENQILDLARASNVSFVSFAVLAVLSCLYDDGTAGYSTANRLLKPKVNYADEDAYNALTDLNLLSLFLGAVALSKAPEFANMAFCTSDKAMTFFWTGLRFRNIRIDQSYGLKAEVELSEFLFPRLDRGQRDDLAERLSN